MSPLIEAKTTIDKVLNELLEGVAFRHIMRSQSDKIILLRRRHIFVVYADRVEHAIDAAVEALIEVDFEVLVEISMSAGYWRAAC